MFGKRKIDTSPLGVPLGDLLPLLQPTTIKAALQGSTLIARHEHYTVRTEVVRPNEQGSDPIQAVVRIECDLPQPVAEVLKPPLIIEMNSFAALGAVCVKPDKHKPYIGSRLTIFEIEADQVWRDLHLPLLLSAIIYGAEPILGAMRRMFANQGTASRETSAWTGGDIKRIENYLSQRCVCTTGKLGLTAEFGLAAGAVSAFAGHKTALFRMMADQPHPDIGGGLFCLLQMPHELPDQERLREVCMTLNQMEMAAADLVPHFGAWCGGKAGNNPAYVSFLPNLLHGVIPGIGENAAIWAMARANWANAALAQLGHRA
jgi:hypothetical protein